MKRHETDALSLGFGVAFLIFAAWAQLLASIEADLRTFGWLVAGGLILCGLLGLFATLRSQRSRTGSSSSAS